MYQNFQNAESFVVCFLQGLPATASLYDLAEKLSNLTTIPQSRMLLKYLRSNDLSLRFVLSPISQSQKMNMIRDIPINTTANQTQCINPRCGLGFYQFDATFFHSLLCGKSFPRTSRDYTYLYLEELSLSQIQKCFDEIIYKFYV